LVTKISQSEAAAANVRVMPERKFVADGPPPKTATEAQLGGSVDPSRDLWPAGLPLYLAL